MKTKLTLTMDETVIEQAKAYAKEQGRSLSAIFENYVKAVSRSERDKLTTEEFSPIVKRLTGSLNLPKNFDYKNAVSEAINEKYSQ
ncbi:DUF6364 family protein [Pedobacter endophyticus]|uniref:Antitoxin n=1 Tax=Pedobacter endophyticus TaxID=2789740 RepID=A0A7S9L2E1_9SPHI|nr:DUF6364 family protein [Pedobacter endophyticus]QPH41202.1 hypothetical protein IZT61_08095 [Pedobacter endophyticus]